LNWADAVGLKARQYIYNSLSSCLFIDLTGVSSVDRSRILAAAMAC
jgi:hypothetical protein